MMHWIAQPTTQCQAKVEQNQRIKYHRIRLVSSSSLFTSIYVYICFTLILHNCIWHHHPSTGGSDCSDPARRWVCLWELLIHKTLYKPFKYIWTLTTHCLTKIFIRLSVCPSVCPSIHFLLTAAKSWLLSVAGGVDPRGQWETERNTLWIYFLNQNTQWHNSN